MLQKQVRFLKSLVATVDVVILLVSFVVAVTIRFNVPFWPHTGIASFARWGAGRGDCAVGASLAACTARPP